MNKLRYTVAAICVLFLLVGCNKDDVAPVQPSTVSNVTTAPLPGAIKISWTREEPVTYEYIKVTYFDKLKKEEMVRLASSYSDTILIPNTRAKYGDYDFTLQPVSITNTEGAKLQVSGKSGAAPKTISVVDVKALALKANDLFTDAQEPSEGPIANLIDGNTGTYFHAAWSVDRGPMPHYIVVKLPRKVNAFKFSYTTRAHSGAGNHPKTMNIYVTEDFNGTTYDVSALTPIVELSGLPNGSAQTFSSDNFILDDEYQYVWFQVKSTHGNTKYFALSELSISELLLRVIDPEAPSEGD